MAEIKYQFTEEEKKLLMEATRDEWTRQALRHAGETTLYTSEARDLADEIEGIDPDLAKKLREKLHDVPTLRCPNCNHEIHLGLPVVPSMVIEGVQYRIDHVEHLPHPGQRDFVVEDSEHRVPIVYVAPI